MLVSFGFSEGSGTTTANGTKRTGTASLLNTTWTTSGKNGNALVFASASPSRVTLPIWPMQMAPTKSMTVMMWVYPTSDPGANENALFSWADTTYGSCFEIESFDYSGSGPLGNPSVYIQLTDANYHPLYGTSKLALNIWTHIAVTFDGSNIRLYRNGTLEQTAVASGQMFSCLDSFEFGSETAWGEAYDGRIDEIRVFDKALSATEITRLMNTAVP